MAVNIRFDHHIDNPNIFFGCFDRNPSFDRLNKLQSRLYNWKSAFENFN